jgi:enamine deaminase RidA (YjgF/YER057c/UK114 family)
MTHERTLVSCEFEPQARAALGRVATVIEAKGGTLKDLVAMTVFVTDIRYGPIFTAIRREVLGSDFPTSACIGVSALMTPGAKIEIQAIAVVPQKDSQVSAGT